MAEKRPLNEYWNGKYRESASPLEQMRPEKRKPLHEYWGRVDRESASTKDTFLPDKTPYAAPRDPVDSLPRWTSTSGNKQRFLDQSRAMYHSDPNFYAQLPETPDAEFMSAGAPKSQDASPDAGPMVRSALGGWKLSEESEARKRGDIVLPSGSILTQRDAERDAFLREIVDPELEQSATDAAERGQRALREQGEARDKQWRNTFEIDPVGQFVADALDMAVTGRKEAGAARIVEDAIGRIDPEKITAYVADRVAGDPEVASATQQLLSITPEQQKQYPAEEDVQRAVEQLTPEQRKTFDQMVEQEKDRIESAQKRLSEVSKAAWSREAEQLQRQIVDRLVERAAERNMPKNELEAFARIAYNATPIGAFTEWAIGKRAGDAAMNAQIMQRAMEKYNPSLATRIGGDVAGLLLSGPLFGVGGALGKAGAAGIRKLAEQRVLKTLAARGVAGGAEGIARRAVAANAATQLGRAAVQSAATLGTYDTVMTPLSMAAAGQDPTAADVLWAAARGTLTGAVLPAIGRTAAKTANAATGRMGRYAAEAGGFAAENAAFVGLGTLVDGLRTGEWGDAGHLAEDFGHSVGTLGILKSIGALRNGRMKNPKFYDKVLSETEFTPDEVRELDRLGVDGRSYKRAVYDLLTSKPTAEGKQLAEQAVREVDSKYNDIMQSDVSMSLKSKLMYLVEGRIPARQPLVTDLQRSTNEQGRPVVALYDPAGNLVQRRTFSTEKAAETFGRESAGLREMNTIEYYENAIKARDAVERTAREIASERGLNPEAAVAEIGRAIRREPHDERLVREAIMRMRPGEESRTAADAIAEEVARKYGMDEFGLDQALAQRAEKRTPEQQAAIMEYAAQLKKEAIRNTETPEQRAERQLMEVADRAIEQTKNRDDGVIYTATMQDGRQANIIKGANLVYDPETGEVDAARSDMTVVVRYEDGTVKQVSVQDIDQIVESMNADQARVEFTQQVGAQLDALRREESLSEVVERNGLVALRDGRIGAVEGVNEDGSFSVAVQDAEGRIVTEQVAAGDIAGPVAEEELYAEGSAAADPLLGRSLTDGETRQLIGQMEAAAAPAPELELTPENWVAQFGEEGKVQTPIGEVKMGENQYFKLAQKGRNGKLGMVRPTLSDPYVIIEDRSQAKEEQTTERPSTYVFVKPFVDVDGERKYLFTSVTVRRDGQEVVISNQEKEVGRTARLLKEGRLIYIKKATLPSESAPSTQGGQSTIPHGESLSNKDTTSIPENQASEPEIPRLKDGQPDFNAMSADMLAVELSEVVGHDKAVERLQVARGVNAKNMEKLRKALAGMGDLNKAMAAEQRIGVMLQEDARLAGALEQLGAVEVPAVAETLAGTFTQEIDRLFPEGLPNVRARVLADIARGQRFVWNDSPDGTKRGVATELGFVRNESERRGRFGMLGSEATGAKHVSSYVHDLWEDSNGYAFDMDDAALRDEVIDVLLSTPSRTAAMEQLRDMAARGTEDAAAPRDAEDLAAMQEYEKQRKILSERENNGNFDEREYPETYGTAAEESERNNDEPAVASGNDGSRLAGDATRAMAGTGDRSDIRVFEKGLDASYNEHSGRSERDRREAESERLVKTATNGTGFNENNGRGFSGTTDIGSRLAGDATRAMAGIGDRSDIRVFEEGLAASYGEYSDGSERDRREAESERLVDAAKANGLYIDEKQLPQFGKKQPGKTGESVVYINRSNGKVYKSKNPYAKAAIKGNTPENAILEHLIHNLLFPETRYTFEGISDHLGDVRIVLSQNLIESVGQPTKEQIEAALTERGLLPEDKYHYGNDLVSVTDVEGDNVLLGQDGKLYFIDPIIRLKKTAGEVIDALSEQEGGPMSDVPFSVVGEASAAPVGVTPERWNVIVDQLRRSVGAENVVTDPAAVRMAYDRIVGRSTEIRRQQVAEVNERFNEQLVGLTPENADSTILDLGMPSPEMLAVGIADKPLRLYGNKLLKKAEKHGYIPSDIRNLPEALESPIAIFKGRYDGAFAILTELNIGGNNVLASIDVNKGAELNVNIITSVYGKEHSRIVRWIEQDRLLYADKKKALDYLIPPVPMTGDPSSVGLSSEKTLDVIGASSPLADARHNQGSVTATNIVTNFENPKIAPENLRRSVAADDALVGVHNLSEENIRHAVRMGGLANPSLAIINTKNADGFDNFGDITLVAPRKLVDKRSGDNAGTFGADIYSPRYPQVQREYGPKLEKLAGDIEQFVQTKFDGDSAVSKRYRHSRAYLNPANAANAERALKREPFMQAYYLENALNKTVPRDATSEQIEALVPDMGAYFDWVNDLFEKTAEREVIFGGYTPAGHPRYLDHTLDNVSRLMKQAGRAGAEGYNNGLGTIRAHLTPKFTTLEQIHKAQKRLQSADEFKQTKDAFEREYEAIKTAVVAVNPRKDSANVIDDHLSMALTQKDPATVLTELGYKPTVELLARLNEFEAALKQMPAEYFETKFERPVRLGEFAGAVVPVDADPKIIAALRESGVRQVESYDPALPDDRARALRVLGDRVNETEGVYFMRTPQGEVYGFTTSGKIYLDSSRMNAETPLHEYTELWSQIVAKEQPELWEQGMRLIKDEFSKIWVQVNEDPNYQGLPEAMRESETLSRIVAADFAGEQAKITDDHNLMVRLRAWLRKFWGALKETFSKWSKKDLDNLTGRQFAKMPMRDFSEKIGLQKYNGEALDQTIGREKTIIREQAQAAGTYLKAPNGKPSRLTTDQWETVRTRQFKEWFGDWENDPENASKVVDENGEPKVFYHNTHNDFTVFDETRNGTANDAGWLGDGFYFYGDENEGRGYGNKRMAVFLNVRGPYYATEEDNYRLSEANDREESIAFREDVESEGYDGVYYNGDLRQEAVVFKPTQIKSATDNIGSFELANPDIRFNREFTERRVTTLEKLENKRAALVADRENIANFDEQLAAVDAGIEAYMQSDPVAETFGEDGVDAASAAHLQAVEDAVYDIVRKEGVEGVQVDVVRSADALLGHARNSGWHPDDIKAIERGVFSFGYYGNGEITLPAWLITSKKEAVKYFWHERTHGVTDEVCTSERLVAAAEQAGAELLDRVLAERDYTSDRWPLERQADEYVARAVEIIAGKGLLPDYLGTPEAKIIPITDYLTERGVPEGLAKIILDGCKYIKNEKYGIDTRTRYDGYHGGGENIQNSYAADTGPGGPNGGTPNARHGAEKGREPGNTGVSGSEIDGRADTDRFDRYGHDRTSADVETYGASDESGDGAVEAGNGLARRNYSGIDGNSGSDGDAGGVRRNGEIGFQQHLEAAKDGVKEGILLRADDNYGSATLSGYEARLRSDDRTAVEADAGADGGGSVALRRGFSGAERRSAADDNEGGVRADDAVGVHSERGGDLKSGAAPKLTKQQQLIADLRRAVRESKASARAVAQIVSRRIREELGRDVMEVMGKREFDAIIRQIEQATVRQDVEKPLQHIAEVVLDLEIKHLDDRVEKLLKLKMQGEGTRGVSVAKTVDDRTRRMYEIFRQNLDRPAKDLRDELRERDDANLLYDLDAIGILELYQEAQRYGREAEEIEKETEALRERNTQLRRERIAANKVGHKQLFEILKSQILYNNSLIDSLNAERVETKEHVAACMKGTVEMLTDRIYRGREILDEWQQQEMERTKTIVNAAFRDVDDGQKVPVLDRQPGVWMQGYRRTMDSLFSPAYSMDYLLKMVSVNAPKGEGELYDHFMRGQDGYVEARGRYYLGYEDFKRVLDAKAREVFGKSYLEVVADSNAPTEATITITNGKVQEQYVPTIGEALYIYMADKMTDGQVKLRRMGIKEEEIAALVGILPSQHVRFADWLQEEFLPERRKVYNATHLAVFGTQMAQIEHYVPLRIQKSYVRQEVDGAESDPDTLPSAITGSIIKRVRNNQILNLHTNVLDLMLEHGQQMEHWNAFTRVVQDMNALLTSTAFRRLLDTRNPGLHKRLKVAAQLAADSYRPQTNDVNRAWIMLGKLAASSKIAFRVNTALKQVLSYPAFYAYTPNPKFWVMLTKNLAPTTWAKNWRWCMDNIPSFYERWLGRMAGDEKLAQMTAPALDKWLDKMNRYGMLPNAFVDALTCANGAMAVYDFRRAEYMKRGREQTEAERLARIDAAVAINATQQSSEGTFISQMQADRDFWSVSLSTFQNSSFAYLRKQLEGIDELFRDTVRERANRSKYYKKQGFSEEEAFDRALKDVVEAKRGALLNIGVFMFGLNLLWGLGSNVWKYLFAPETREEIPGELAKSALVAPIRNSTIGSIAESFANGYDANPSVLLSDMIAFTRRVNRIARQENIEEWDQTPAYLALQTLTANGVGIDLESFVNMCQGIAGMIRDGYDVEDLMRVLNAPKSQAKLIAGRPKDGETDEEYQCRMLFTERKIASRVKKKTLDKWSRNYEAYRTAELLEMDVERGKTGNVVIPELKALDENYKAALKQLGLMSDGDSRHDLEWAAMTAEEQERWRSQARKVRKIYDQEAEIRKSVVLNDAYKRQMEKLIRMKKEFVESVNAK